MTCDHHSTHQSDLFCRFTFGFWPTSCRTFSRKI